MCAARSRCRERHRQRRLRGRRLLRRDLGGLIRPSLDSSVCRWAWLGRISFDAALSLQEHLRSDVVAGEGPETLLLCEHEPVITLGRNARADHVLAPADELTGRGIALRHVSRGGDVTYHGPGQLVGYPIFRLRTGLVVHMQRMASAIVEVLAELGISSEWRRERPGVWVGEDKICAFGIHVRHRVAIHGFALNVATPPEAFASIVPCGLRGAGVTSVARLRGSAPPLDELAGAMTKAFERSFGVALEPCDPLSISSLARCNSPRTPL